MKYIAAFLLLLIAPLVVAQTKASTPAPGKDIPVALQAKILKLQLKQSQLQQSWAQVQEAAKQVQEQFQETNAELQAVQDEALKAMKLDPAKFTIDLATLRAIPKPGPGKAPSPAEKK